MHSNAQVTYSLHHPATLTDLTYPAARLYSGDVPSLRTDHSNGLELIKDRLRYQAVPRGKTTKLPSKEERRQVERCRGKVLLVLYRRCPFLGDS